MAVVRFSRDTDSAKRCEILRHEILLCVKANNIKVPGEFALMLAMRNERELRRICSDLHIVVQVATGEAMPVAGG